MAEPRIEPVGIDGRGGGNVLQPGFGQTAVADPAQPGSSGLLATQGSYVFLPPRRELPQRLRREIKREFRRLELVLEQVEASEAERDAAVAAPVADDIDASREALPSKLGGIGTELASVLARRLTERVGAVRGRIREIVPKMCPATPSPE